MRWLCLLVLLVSCSKGSLDIRNEYVTKRDLASHRANTPDSERLHPPEGQRLRVMWSIKKRVWRRLDVPQIHLTVRYGNRDERTEVIPIGERRGEFVYNLLNDEYHRNEGIRTWFAEIIDNDEVIARWEHQIWAHIIRVGEQLD